MKENNDGFVRADQIDLKSLDELERHLNRALTLEKTKRSNSDDNILITAGATATPNSFKKQQRQDWEIDPTKLIIKSVIARGTFGTVHRGICDGQDVAGQSLFNHHYYLQFYVLAKLKISSLTVISYISIFFLDLKAHLPPFLMTKFAYFDLNN